MYTIILLVYKGRFSEPKHLYTKKNKWVYQEDTMNITNKIKNILTKNVTGPVHIADPVKPSLSEEIIDEKILLLLKLYFDEELDKEMKELNEKCRKDGELSWSIFWEKIEYLEGKYEQRNIYRHMGFFWSRR